MTAAELHAAAEPVARALAGRPGPVGLLLPDRTDTLVAFLAALRAGRPAVVLQHAFTAAERAAALEDAGCEEVLTELPCDSGDSPLGLTPRGEDPMFYVGFTSGSSGRPKAFARRLRSWTDSFAATSTVFAIGDRVVLPGPLDHSLFLFGAVHAMWTGADVVTLPRFDPDAVLAELTGAPATVYLVPTMLHALAERATAPLLRVRSVVCGGAKLEARHWTEAAELFPHARTRELYGASELSFVTVADGPPRVEGEVGRPFPGVELDLRDGVVHVRSPYLFAGYLRRGALEPPALTADGFATVGDLGERLPDGALRLTGRASNLVVTGGKNVHPEEVEAALAGVPGVAAAGVTGRPDPYWGERLCAYVVLDRPVAAADALAALRARLAAHKVPKELRTVPRLPRTASGKLARAELARWAAAGRGEPWA